VPVIVRSEKVTGVVYYANYWRNKHPKIYHCFFPESGWTISDLWDNADIHLESPGFLEEVLRFICQDNAVRANHYVVQWSKAHPEKLDMIGGDMSQIYDIHYPAAIVDMIFTDGETEQYPHMFLWHVFHNMRICMSIAMKKQQAAKATANAQGVAKADGEAASSVELACTSAMGNFAVTAQVKQPQSASSPGVGPRKNSCEDSQSQTQWLTEYTDPLQQAGTPYLYSSTAAPVMNTQPGFSGPPPQGPSFASSQPGRLYSNHANGYPISQPAAAVPVPYANSQLRNPKNRATRSTSNPYGIPPQTHGWGDNIAFPFEHQIRQPSGPIPAGPNSHFVQTMPIGPGMVSSNPMSQLPPNGSLPSPQIHPIQARYPSTMQQNMMPPQASPYVVYHMDGSISQFGPGGSDQHVMPFGDMTNNGQYPPPRGTDLRGTMSRRPSYVNKPSRLYDPYGTERPDKAGFTHIPTKANVGKTRHNSVSNNNGRPRKYSANFGSQSLDRDGSVRPNGHLGDSSHMRGSYMPFNEGIVNDLDIGCCNSRIGPNNTTVLELHVTNIPKDVTMEELGSFFHQHGKVTPTQVALRISAGFDHFTHAFVYFSSTAEARQGLRMNNKSLRGRNLAVSVPRRYWQHLDAATSVNGQILNSHAQGGNRVSSYSSHSPTDDKGAPTVEVQYSPQDARSDLRRTSHQHQEHPATRGSPEVRKRKTHTSSERDVFKNEEQLHVDKVNCFADKLDVIPEQPVPAGHVDAHQPAPAASLSVQQPNPVELVEVESPAELQASGVNTETVRSSTEDVVPDQPVVLLTPEVVTEESWTKTSDMEGLRSDPLEDVSSEGTTIIYPTPVDHAFSPKRLAAKVILPRAVDSPSNADEKLSTSQNTAMENEHAGDSHPEGATISVRAQDDTSSDDDQKNDLSFHSAQESQSDAGVIERKGEVFSSADVGHGPPAPSTSKTTLSMPQQLGSEPASEKFDAAELDVNASQLPESKESVTAVEKLPTDAAKKPGAKQTQSLFPFAKPSKSQAKKEKQAKKKDKRKDKDKARTEKAAPSIQAITIAASRLPGHSHTPKLEAQSGHATVAEATIDSEASHEDIIDTANDTRETDSTLGVVGEAHDEGKQENQKTDIQQSTVAQKAMQTHLGDPILEACVPYHSEVPGAVSLPQCMPIAAEQEQQSKDKEEHARKTKHTPPMIAVPKLGDLLKIRPSPASKATALGTMSPDPGPSKPSKGALVAHKTGDGKFEPCIVHQPQLILVDNPVVVHISLDQASIGSSPTLRAESPPPISPSPTTSTFFTPVQTPSDFPRSSAIGPPPSALGPLSSEPSKKKKSKKKKKTGSSGVDTGNNASTANDEVKEPFADQLSEIEGIKSANTTGNYYLRSAQEPAGKESRSEDKVRPALVSSMT